MKATIAAGSVQDTLHIARELFRRGELERFVTGFPKWRIQQMQHNLEPLPEEKIIAYPVCEYLWQVAKRMPLGAFPSVRQQVQDWGLEWRFELFDRLASDSLGQPDLVITFGGAGREHRCLQIARAHGAKVARLYGSTHPHYQQQILAEEREKFGLRFRPAFSQRIVDRMSEELELCDYIDVPSEFVRQSFIKRGIPASRLMKHPYGVDIDFFRPVPKRDPVFRVLFVGTIGLRKGIQYLLPAYAKVCRENWELQLVGMVEDDILKMLAQYVEYCRTPGIIRTDEMPEIYANASVFVLPSLEEGLARVIPEAMACGVPVIITPNTGGEELVRDGIEGFVVPARDVEALADRLGQLWRDEEMRLAMGKNARNRAEQFTWQGWAERFVDSYRGLVEVESVGG